MRKEAVVACSYSKSFLEILKKFKEKRVRTTELQTKNRIRDFPIMEETNKYINKVMIDSKHERKE
jgi:uncharacterized protein YbaR (Trm112 family)